MDLFIYGAGATGRELVDIVRRCQQAGEVRWSRVLFVDDVTDATQVAGLEVVRFEAMHQWSQPRECVIALGEPMARMALFNKLQAHGIALATLIDPKTTLSPTARIGAGCIVGPGAFISCDTELAENVMVEINCIIGHDIRIGAHAVVSSCTVLGGHSSIGSCSFTGMNVSVRERVRIGERTIIGMASAVFNDVPDDVIALGNPARVMRKNEDHRVFKSTGST